MPKETASHINQLVSSNPDGADPKSQGDDHIRMIKQVLLADFPNIGGAVTADHTELSYCDGVTSAIQTQLNAKAPLASPALTGVPTVPTAAADTNTTQAASTAYVVGQAGSAAPAMNGVAAAGASLRYARQDHVHPSDTSRGSLSGNNAWTGSNSYNFSPTVPTPATWDNTGKVANTSFVLSQIAASVPSADTATAGRTRYATNAEAQNFANTGVSITPASLDQAYRGSNQGTHWQRLPGGRYVQWYEVYLGNITSGAPGTAWSVTFDTGFPARLISFSFGIYDAAAQGAVGIMVTSKSQWGISGYVEEWAGLGQDATLFITVWGE